VHGDLTARWSDGKPALSIACAPRRIFDKLDTDGSDDLDYTELKQALQNYRVEVSLEQLKKLWTAADKDASSGISFEEFLTAVQNMDDSELKQQLKSEEDNNCTVM